MRERCKCVTILFTRDRRGLGRQKRKLLKGNKSLSATNDDVSQMMVAFVLVLDQIVENLKNIKANIAVIREKKNTGLLGYSGKCFERHKHMVRTNRRKTGPNG